MAILFLSLSKNLLYQRYNTVHALTLIQSAVLYIKHTRIHIQIAMGIKHTIGLEMHDMYPAPNRLELIKQIHELRFDQLRYRMLHQHDHIINTVSVKICDIRPVFSCQIFLHDIMLKDQHFLTQHNFSNSFDCLLRSLHTI